MEGSCDTLYISHGIPFSLSPRLKGGLPHAIPAGTVLGWRFVHLHVLSNVNGLDFYYSSAFSSLCIYLVSVRICWLCVYFPCRSLFAQLWCLFHLKKLSLRVGCLLNTL